MMMGMFVPFLGVLLFQQTVMVGGTCNSKLGRFFFIYKHPSFFDIFALHKREIFYHKPIHKTTFFVSPVYDRSFILLGYAVQIYVIRITLCGWLYVIWLYRSIYVIMLYVAHLYVISLYSSCLWNYILWVHVI